MKIYTESEYKKLVANKQHTGQPAPSYAEYLENAKWYSNGGHHARRAQVKEIPAEKESA